MPLPATDTTRSTDDSVDNRILTGNTVLTLGSGLDAPAIRGAGERAVRTER